MDVSFFILDLGWGEHLDLAAMLSEEIGNDAVLKDCFK